jgi:hypothetical protein
MSAGPHAMNMATTDGFTQIFHDSCPDLECTHNLLVIMVFIVATLLPLNIQTPG